MNNLTHLSISSILIGLGATLTFDLWSLFLKYTFHTSPSNFCMVGRWLRYMPEGVFRHANIGFAPQKSGECITGWVAHYVIGIVFAIGFVAFVGRGWFQHPTLLPALIFGMVTVLAPFFIMQPSIGLGIAASRTSNPRQVKVRSLMNHAVFGFGLYIFGLLVSWLL